MASPFVTGKRDVPLSQWTVDGNAGHVWEGGEVAWGQTAYKLFPLRDYTIANTVVATLS